MHLVFGVVGLMLIRSYASARAYLIGGGLAYLAIWVAGCSSTTSEPTSARPAVPTTGCTSDSARR
jgi:hypothetical protein